MAVPVIVVRILCGTVLWEDGPLKYGGLLPNEQQSPTDCWLLPPDSKCAAPAPEKQRWR